MYFCGMQGKQIIKLLLVPILVILADVFFRWNLLEYYYKKHLWFYFSSLIISLGFTTLLLLVLKRIAEKKKLYYPVSFVVFGIFLFVLGASFAFKSLNNLFPNYYTLLYFKTEPKSAFMIIRDVAGWFEICIGIFVLIMISFFSRPLLLKHIPHVSWKTIAISYVLTIFAFEGLVSFHNKFDQCAIVDINFAACVQRHLVTWDDHSVFKGKGLSTRRLMYKEPKKHKAPFNVLVIVCESLRKKSLSIYGNKNPNTPNLNSFSQEHSEDFYVFKNPFTVSTTTMLAVPATLSGIAPYQDSSVLYSQPLIWDYAKHFSAKRFFLSSHTLEWYNFQNYYKNDSLDVWWNHDNSNLPYFNDLGVKDGATIHKTIQTLRSFNAQAFIGVIQLNTTHYPYRVPPKYEKWKKTYRDSYDNSVYYQDAILGELFSYMETNGMLENTVILITSDHGESLMEHRNIGHVESNYYETVAIPLLAFIPNSLTNEKVRSQLRKNQNAITSNIDIVPTLLDLWDIEKHRNWKSFTRNLTGFSLLKEIPDSRSIISLNNNQVASFNTGLSLISKNYHYLLRTNVMPYRQEFYYYPKDPKESNNFGNNVPKHIKNIIRNEIQKYPVCDKFKSHLF